MLLTCRKLVFGINSFHRTFGLTQRAIDAFVRINHQEVRPFVETIHGTNLDAIRQFALDTGFGDNERHAGYLKFRSAYAMRSRRTNQGKIGA